MFFIGIVLVLVIVFLFVGIFVGIFLVVLLMQRVVRRHMQILWLKEETKRFRITDQPFGKLSKRNLSVLFGLDTPAEVIPAQRRPPAAPEEMVLHVMPQSMEDATLGSPDTQTTSKLNFFPSESKLDKDPLDTEDDDIPDALVELLSVHQNYAEGKDGNSFAVPSYPDGLYTHALTRFKSAKLTRESTSSHVGTASSARKAES